MKNEILLIASYHSKATSEEIQEHNKEKQLAFKTNEIHFIPLILKG